MRDFRGLGAKEKPEAPLEQSVDKGVDLEKIIGEGSPGCMLKLAPEVGIVHCKFL